MRLARLLPLAACALAGCGYVAIGAALWPEDDEDPVAAPHTPPAVIVVTPTGVQSAGVPLSYLVTDAEGDPANLAISYAFSTDGGGSWSSFTTATEKAGAGSEGRVGLAASPTGTTHLFVWDSQADVGSVAGLARVRTVPTGPDGVAGAPAETALAGFAVDNVNLMPVAAATSPSGNQWQRVTLAYTLADPEADLADVAVEYALSTDGGLNFGAWNPASETLGAPSEGTTGLAAAAAGTAHTFVWSAFGDTGGVNVVARLRVTPSDPGPPLRVGSPVATAPFPLVNHLIATVLGGGTGVLEVPGGVARDGSGNLYVADTFNHRVQVLNTQGSSITVGGVVVASNALGVIAGTTNAGFNGDNQAATQAELNFPSGVALDGSGHLYVADSLNHRIRRVDRVTGFITTVAGTGNPGFANDGALATTAEVREPRGVSFDGPGNLWIADARNHMVRVVNRQATTITLAGVTIAAGRLARVAGDANGNAGLNGDNGPATSAELDQPWAVVVDSAGIAFVADRDNHAVRAINPGTSSASVLGQTIAAGDILAVVGTLGTAGFGGDGGPTTSALLDQPAGLAVDASDVLFVADTGNARVRVANTTGAGITRAGVSVASGDLDTVAGGGTPASGTGDGGAATSAKLKEPRGCGCLAAGDVAIADSGHGLLRVVNVGASAITVAGVTIAAGDIDRVAGALAGTARLSRPAGLVRLGDRLFHADQGDHRVSDVHLKTGVVTVLAGTGASGFSGDNGAAGLALLDSPRGCMADGAGNLYVADWGNQRVRVVNRQSSAQTLLNVSVPAGAIATVAGGGFLGGDGSAATTVPLVNAPGVALDGAGNLVIAHATGNRIRVVNASTGIITALAGSALAGFADGSRVVVARFDGPQGVCVDGSGNLVVADTNNHAVRYVNLSAATVTVCGVAIANGTVGTIAGLPPGTGPQAGFNGDGQFGTSTLLDTPVAVAREAAGHVLVVDAGNQRIRRISHTTRIVTTIGGTGTPGFNGDGKPPVNAHVNGPADLLLDGATPTNLFFADAGNRRIRRFSP